MNYYNWILHKNIKLVFIFFTLIFFQSDNFNLLIYFARFLERKNKKNVENLLFYVI